MKPKIDVLYLHLMCLLTFAWLLTAWEINALNLHCLVALLDILNAFKVPENLQQLNEAREHAGNDMLKTMQIVFPITTRIQMQIISKYGFPADGDGGCRLSL